jgi:hypothetical protein
MMRLSETVARPIALMARPRSPLPARLREAVARVHSRWPDVVPQPREEDRDAILRAFRERIDRDDWERARMRDATAAARAAFDPQRIARTEYDGVRSFLIAETRVSSRAGFLGCMASVHLECFAPERAHTVALAAALHEALPRIPGRWRALLEQAPEALDPARGPDRIARRMLDHPEPYRMLEALGFVSPHGPGFLAHAHRAFVSLMRPLLRRGDRNEFERMLAWLQPAGRPARTADAGSAIAAMLTPWTTQEPPEDLRAKLIAELTLGWGDPRLHKGGAWVDVPEAEKAVLFRWLTGETLEAFLEIMTEQKENDTADAERMWRNRVDFWRNLYKQNRIDSAWAALSSDGETIARRRAQRGGNEGLAKAFGRQVSGGSRSRTSILIVKCGDKIVVEGSDNYKVHIFRDADPNAPRLFQNRYECERIRRSLSEREKRAHNGDWQSWVLERI